MVVATGGGIGYAPVVPATFGSAAAAVFYALLLEPIGRGWLVLLIVVGTAVAMWSADRVSGPGNHDPKYVVCDEVVGTWIALFTLPGTWPYLLGGFLLFRVFDVIKPFPIRRLERLPGGIGVVADDLLAGVYVAVVLQIVAQLV